jgi:hypothetical protein
MTNAVKGMGVRSTLDSRDASLDRFHFPPQAPVIVEPLLHAGNHAARAAVMLQSKDLPYGCYSDAPCKLRHYKFSQGARAS